MTILVLNCGSSSVKFQLIANEAERSEQNTGEQLAHGIIERLGSEASITLAVTGYPRQRSTEPLHDMRAAIEFILRWACAEESGIPGIKSVADIHAVGHRVVHGGEQFKQSVLITDEVLEGIAACSDLAPLHNPANLAGINAVRDVFSSGVPQVAVFDTAFHHTLPEHAYLYALPYQLYQRHRIRRYGFHGTSHRYVAERYRQLKNIPRDQTHLITLHLGNGCSAAAIKAGISVDTSMGLTPLEGLVMGTRCGDLDPAIVEFVAAKESLSAQEVETILNEQSGLLGLSGLSQDMRDLLDATHKSKDDRATLAIEIFCYRARKYIGSYLAAMNGAEAVVFTGGVGENSAEVRATICDGLSWLGLTLDSSRNHALSGGQEGVISTDNSRLAAYVIPTNEEALIARDTMRVVSGVPQHL